MREQVEGWRNGVQESGKADWGKRKGLIEARVCWCLGRRSLLPDETKIRFGMRLGPSGSRRISRESSGDSVDQSGQSLTSRIQPWGWWNGLNGKVGPKRALEGVTKNNNNNKKSAIDQYGMESPKNRQRFPEPKLPPVVTRRCDRIPQILFSRRLGKGRLELG